MKEMLFIQANATWPKGQVWSTARRGDKWSKDATPGDALMLFVTESRKHLANATVVKVRLTTFKDACDSAAADNNHAIAPGMDDGEAAEALRAGLKAAYGGDLKDDEPFTVVSLIANNPES